jgi:hypothetical protein
MTDTSRSEVHPHFQELLERFDAVFGRIDENLRSPNIDIPAVAELLAESKRIADEIQLIAEATTLSRAGPLAKKTQTTASRVGTDRRKPSGNRRAKDG